MDPEKVDLELLMQIAQAKSASVSSGHLTIMKFSTCWKVMFGTPNLDTGKGRIEVWELKKYKTLKEALIDILTREDIKYG